MEKDMRSPVQEDTILSEEELLRTTEKMIYGRTLQQVTEEILSKAHCQPIKTVSTRIPPVKPPVQAASTVNSHIAPSVIQKSRNEKRMEAKRKWFLKKRMKTVS